MILLTSLLFASPGYILSNDTTCHLSGTSNQTGVYPRLKLRRDFGRPTATVSLMINSPALKFGNPADSAGRLDQRGVPIVGGRSDSGAFEYIPPSVWLSLVVKPMTY